ncbi:MAG: squalene synthase HpnC [Bacteroidetes bacterium]|nr:squalene synthase HpnC [Bacteroidota bacterium]MCL6097074.1 squalene synthase HpnC [Bacteroidota bacterium]
MKNISTDGNKSLDSTYLNALKFTKSHYENFPVVSLFLPKVLRKHVAVVYQFARQADDIADEGITNLELTRFDLLNANDARRGIENLERYEEHLKNSIAGKFENDFWFALNNTISEFKLTPNNFFDLLKAFKQDVIKTRYDSFNEVLNYCEHSANPVGRIILEFFGIREPEAVKYSDSICTALQLTNFYQDVSIDFLKNRIYIPLDELKAFGVELNQFELKKNNANFKMLLEHQVKRNRELYAEGKNLLALIPRGLRRQIYMTILGGEKILEKIEAIDYDVLNKRPSLSKMDYTKIFLRSAILSND